MKPINMTDEEKVILLDKLKRQRTESYERTQTFREEGKKIKKYARGDQLPADVLAVLQGRDQPIEYENIIMKIANKIMGLKILSKQEIQVFGRQVEDKAVANVFTNILRASQDNTQWWSHKKRADKDLLFTGLSIMKPVMKELGELDILGVKQRDLGYYHVPMENGYFDPYFTAPDGSDMRYFHEVRLLDRDDLYQFFDEELVDKLPLAYSTDFEGTPQSNLATTDYSQRVMITYSWYKEWDKKEKKMVFYYAIWGEDTLLTHSKSPYNMKRIPVSIRRVYDADADNPCEFYSPFRNILPMQDKINFTHLRIANMMGSIKMLFENDAVEDAETFMEEYSLDSSIVEVRSGAISANKIKEIKHNNDIAQLMNIIMDKRAQAEEIIGLNNELLGTSVQRLSGYAIEHRQNAGMVGLQLYIDASLEQDRDLAHMGISLANQYINAEQIYSIVDKMEADRVFTVNEIEKEDGVVQYDEESKPKRKNKLQIGKYDLVLQAMPQSRGSIAERQKNWVEIMKLFAGNGAMLEQLLPRMLRDIDSPVAQEVLEVVKAEADAKANNPMASQMQQIEQQQIVLQLQKLQAEIAKLTSQANVNNAKAGELGGQETSVVKENLTTTNETGGQIAPQEENQAVA